jgi:hypothetical protein
LGDIVDHTAFGSSPIVPEVLAAGALKVGHTYKVKFGVDTLFNVPDYDHGQLYTNNGIFVYDADASNTLVYQETPEKYAFKTW